MQRRSVGYSELAVRLTAIGLVENRRNLVNKVNRGTFSAAFLLACLEVLGAPALAVPEA